MKQRILNYFFMLLLMFIQQVNTLAVKDFRFIQNQQIINTIKNKINLEKITCNFSASPLLSWILSRIPRITFSSKEFCDEMNSGRKMSENCSIDYSKIIFGTLNKSKNIILILAPLFYKNKNIVGEILFKCSIKNLNDSSIQEVLSYKESNLKLDILTQKPRITIFDNSSNKWNPPRYDDLKTLEKKLQDGKFKSAKAAGPYLFAPSVILEEKLDEEDTIYYYFETSGGCDLEESDDEDSDDEMSEYIAYGCFLKINDVEDVWVEVFNHFNPGPEV